MRLVVHRETVFSSLLLAILVLFAPAVTADLIQRDPAQRLDARSVVEPSYITEGVLSREIVRVDAAFLASAPETLWLELAPGEWRLAFRADVERSDGGGLVWRGRFAEDDPGYVSVILSLHAGTVVGSIDGGALDYTLRPAGGGMTALATASADRPLHCAADAPEAFQEKASDALDGPTTEGTVGAGPASALPPPGPERLEASAEVPTLSILVLYLPSVAETWGGHVYAIAYAHHAVDALNTAFQNSRITARARLTGVREWTPQFFLGNIAHLLDKASVDPWVDEVRQQAGGDLVAILGDAVSTRGCGIARLMTRPLFGPLMAQYAFSATNVDCEGHDHLTFAHEIGHNLGGQHNPEVNTPSNPVFPYALGYLGTWGDTIMSYGSRQLIYSNPTVTFRGAPMGIEGERDVARAFNQTIPVAAAFRSGGSEVPRVDVPPPVPPRPINLPGSPTDLSARVLSSTRVELTWKDNGSGEIAFEIEARKQGGEYEVVAEAPPNLTLPNIVTWTVDGLEPGTTYDFRVRAVGEEGRTPYTNVVRVTTRQVPPAAPEGLAAEPVSAGSVRLAWDAVDRADGYEVEVRTADPAADRGPEPISLGTGGAVLEGLQAATPYTVRVRAVNSAGASEWSPPASATTLGADGPCLAGEETLCLLDGRFEIRARWRNPREPFDHGPALARPAQGSQRTGLFTFFDPDNVELVVKMLDGRPVNGAFWHFYGALSDVEYWVSVRDTAEGGVRTYHNEPFELCGRGDTAAFVAAPPPPEEGTSAAAFAAAAAAAPSYRTAASEGACVPDEEALCLAGGRFRVEVDWENPRIAGDAGTGKVFAGLDGDRSGHFWFFRPDNLELSVKILDGRSLNGHFWIFWGGLSDVGYTLRVTDTESGQSHDFVNPPLTLCGGAVTNVL